MARLAPVPGSGSRWESVDGDPRIVVGSTVLLGSRCDSSVCGFKLIGCRAVVTDVNGPIIRAQTLHWRRRDCVLIDEEKQRALEALKNVWSFFADGYAARDLGDDNVQWLMDARIVEAQPQSKSLIVDRERLARALGESTSVELVEEEPTERRVMKLLQGVQRFNEGSEVERVIGVSNLEWLVVSGILDKNIAFMADSCPVYYIVNHTRLQQALGEWEPPVSRPQYAVGDWVYGGSLDWAGQIVVVQHEATGDSYHCYEGHGGLVGFRTAAPIHVGDVWKAARNVQMSPAEELGLLYVLLTKESRQHAQGRGLVWVISQQSTFVGYHRYHPQAVLQWLHNNGYVHRGSPELGTLITEFWIKRRITELSGALYQQVSAALDEIARMTSRHPFDKLRAMTMCKLAAARGLPVAQTLERELVRIDKLRGTGQDLPGWASYMLADKLYCRQPDIGANDEVIDALTLRAVREQTEWLRAQGCVDESPPAELDWLGGPTVGIDGKLGTS